MNLLPEQVEAIRRRHARRYKANTMAAACADVGSLLRDRDGQPAPAEIWDAINEYAAACGGDTSSRTISPRRMNAVVAVERAIAAGVAEASK